MKVYTWRLLPYTWIFTLWIFTTTVLVAGLPPTVRPTVRNRRPPGHKSGPKRTNYACEGSTLEIYCDGGTIIQVERANYGRFSVAVCNARSESGEGWDIQCMSTRSLRIVSSRCDGKSHCSFPVNNSVFGDPCSTTPKYLEAQYKCVKVTESTSTPSTTTAAATTTKRPCYKVEGRGCGEDVVTMATSQPKLSTRKPTPPAPTKDKPWKPEFCEPIHHRNVSWHRTKAGRQAIEPCPNNPRYKAYWMCGSEPVEWYKDPDLSHCVSNWVDDLSMMIDNGAPAENVARIIENNTHVEDLFGGDLAETTDMMTRVLDSVKEQTNNETQETKVKVIKQVGKAIVQSGSNLLSRKQENSWKDLPQDDQRRVGTLLVIAMEKNAYQVAEMIEKPAVVTDVQENIIMELEVVNSTKNTDPVLDFPKKKSLKNTNWENSTNSLGIPSESLKDYSKDGLVRVVFLTYNNLNQWLSPTAANTTKDGRFVNTKVISASINNRKGFLPLSKPMRFTLDHYIISKVENPSCSFWNFSDNTLHGQWSTSGCRAVETSSASTTCECDHLTNFAVLMDVSGTKLESHHVLNLEIITYCGCIISIVCLLAALLTFAFFKNLSCDRNTIHKHLVFCLLVAEVIFLAGIVQTDKPIVCALVAGLLHYFFLAAFGWMCLEGIQLYVMLIEVFEAEKSRVCYYYTAAYGIPAVIVGVSAGLRYEYYGTDKHCWLSTEKGFIWSFVGPVAGVITVNIVMLSIAIYMMCKHANAMAAVKTKEKSRLDNVKSWVKGAMVLVVLLGLTWVFGLLFIDKESVAMAYIFAALNSLQGLFIFVFHCIMNDKVQKEYKRLVRRTRWLPDCIRAGYGGHKGLQTAYQTSSPQQSSGSSGLNYFQKLLSGRRRKKSSVTTLGKTSTPTKWQFQPMKPDQHTNGTTSTGRGSLTGQSSTGTASSSRNTRPQRKHPPLVTIRIDNEDSLNMDLSCIDASVVDSDNLSAYCQNNLSDYRTDSLRAPNNKRISTLSGDSCCKNRLSLLDTDRGLSESEFSDGELFRLTDRERVLSEHEQQPLVPKTISEENSLNLLETDKPKSQAQKGNSTNMIEANNVLNSRNDLNKDDSGHDSSSTLHSSTPNIKFKAGGLNPADDTRESHLCSMPNLAFDPESPDSEANEKPPPYPFDEEDLPDAKAGKLRRTNSDTQTKFDPHRYRLDGTDC